MTKTTRAQITRNGGPEVIEWVEDELPPPAHGEVSVAHKAVGLNFIDTYHRRGIYPVELPSALGLEAAGRIVAVGEGVEGFSQGDRVATFGPSRGAYATHRNMATSELFALPDAIDARTAAAAILKASTAEFLVERCAKVQRGQDVLVHAAAGGVGLLLVQWLKHLGARVIGTVSSEDKAAEARKAGADDIVFYGREDVAPRVRELTGGKGAEVVFDGIGKATWDASIEATASRGLLVSYGNADAPVGAVDLGILARKGSLFTTRPALFDYYAEPRERAAGIARVWEMIGSGVLSVTIGQTYPLTDAATAHRDLEARKTTGSTLLLP